MKRIRYLLVLVAIFFSGSCAKSTLEIEQEDETFCNSRSGNNPIEEALNYLRGTRLGRCLWHSAISRLPEGSVIGFSPVRNIPKRSMKYMGKGWILYNPDDLHDGDLEQLAFHELFHVYKQGDVAKQILNDEVEAYLVQYIFLVSEGKETKFDVDGGLRECIKELAKYVDMNTGEIRHPKWFRVWYDKTLAVIRTMDLYKNKEGQEPWIEEAHRDISFLSNFFKNIN